MGGLLRTERYKLLRDKIYWITFAVIVLFNVIMLSGSSVLNLTGYGAMMESMKKEIATVLITCIYGGIFIGGDFADRTLYHGLMAGKSRSSVLAAKSIVFAIAADGLLFLFPLLLVLTCTIKNGWGMTVSGEMDLHLIGVIAALLILGFAISTLSLLAAVCLRDVGRTIGIPIVLCFMMILLLNSAYASAFSRIFPIGTLILVADGTVSPAYGVLLGAVWTALLTAISTLVFRRAELR